MISTSDDGQSPSAPRCRRSGCGSPRCPAAGRSPACCSPSSGCRSSRSLLTPFRSRPRLHQRGVLLPHARGGRSPRSGASGRPRFAAVAGFALLNWFFAEPIHTFTIRNERDLAARGRLPARRRRREHPRRRGGPSSGRGEPGAERGRGARRHGRIAAAQGRSDPRAARQPRGAVPARPRRRRAHRTRPGGPRRGRAPPAVDEADAHPSRSRRVSSCASPAPTCWAPTARCSAPSPPSSPSPSRRRRLQAEAADRRGADAGQRAAHRPARRREPRPAHPAGVDQGVVVEPALRRRVVHRRAGPSPAGDDRRGGRPAQQPGGEPARHEPHPGRRARGEAPGGRPRRGDRRRPERPPRPGPRHPPRRARDAPGGRR